MHRKLFEGYDPPSDTEEVPPDDLVGEFIDEATADPLDVLRHQTRKRDRLCKDNPLPDQWPHGLSHFRGSKVRLGGLHVYYDFAWIDKVPHNRRTFPEGQVLATFVRDQCPGEKEAALLLTVRDDVIPGVITTENLYIAIVQIDQYLNCKKSPATTYFYSNLAASFETLQHVAKNPQLVQQIVKNNLDAAAISNWIEEDPTRITLLREIISRTQGPPEQSVASLESLVQKWAAGEIPQEDVKSVVSSLNNDEKLGHLISALADRAEELKSLPRLGQEDSRRMVAAALRASHRADALALLKQHIKNNVVESVFQKLLETNWWMLGTQYVGIVTERHVTTEENVDILLHRADGYFDLIELKRAKGKTFVEDHEKWIVSSEVNRAVNQTAHYIAEIEASRSDILRKKFVDLFKLHGFVIIGNLEEDDPHVRAKREALRLYNSHLHRVTVMTYDQLVRIAEEVVKSNEGEVKYAAELSTVQQPDTDCAEGQEEEPFDEDACQGDGGDP